MTYCRSVSGFPLICEIEPPTRPDLRHVRHQIEIPDDLVDRVAAHPDSGVEAACEQIDAVRQTGAFAGVHLVPVNRYRQIAARLEGTR